MVALQGTVITGTIISELVLQLSYHTEENEIKCFLFLKYRGLVQLYLRTRPASNLNRHMHFLAPVSYHINLFNSLTPMSDQDRISPYNTNTITTRYMIRIKKNTNLGIIS